MWLLWLFLALLLLGLVTLFVRALRLKTPSPMPVCDEIPVSVDFPRALRHLQAMIRFPTVSYPSRNGEDIRAFDDFQKYLTDAYPHISERCARSLHGATGLLYCWPGRVPSSEPTVFMAHYDVVPVERSLWSRDPFGGEVVDDTLWGRGTLDTKSTLCAIMEAVESLIADGFVPEHDVYLSFSGDEETHGSSCPAIVDWFREKGLCPRFVLDEGGAVVPGIFPGIDSPLAVVGIAEKGQMDLSLELSSTGGHASAPGRHTALGELCLAGAAIERHPFPLRFEEPVARTFVCLGRHAGLGMRLLLANVKLFLPLLDWLTRQKGGELNAMLRTTNALTIAEGSEVYNVIPPQARLGINLRTMPEETEEAVIRHLNKICRNPRISCHVRYFSPASPVSRCDGPAYEQLNKTIAQTWPEAVMTPYLMLASSDSRHFAQISDSVYRFSAMRLSAEERGLIHSHDEHLRLAEWRLTLAFYQRLIRTV